MNLLVLRLGFIIVTIGLGVFIILWSGVVPEDSTWMGWVILGGTIVIALATIFLDIIFPRKRLDTISAVYFGLIVGLFLAYVLGLALTPLFAAMNPINEPYMMKVRAAIQLIITAVLCYLCISLLLQTKNDFRFIIPYVEFSKEVKGARPYILDTSVIIDGRIADLVESQLFDTQLVIPRFVITELQAIADSSDRLKRTRGRRGLDILNRLRKNPEVSLEIYDRELPEFAGQSVDLKLVALAKHLHGKLMTNDYNLNKVARLHGVSVLNLNDLANALKPLFLPGERVEVRIVKSGEGAGQGVGYLDDGTMVVVEGGRDYIGQWICLTVTSVLQTSAGRMVFGRFESVRPMEELPRA